MINGNHNFKNPSIVFLNDYAIPGGVGGGRYFICKRGQQLYSVYYYTIIGELGIDLFSRRNGGGGSWLLSGICSQPVVIGSKTSVNRWFRWILSATFVL